MAIHSDASVTAPEPITNLKLLDGDVTITKPTAHEEANGSVYKIKEQWHSQSSNLRVINVGAGAAGLLMAYKMKKEFENYELVCYEKSAPHDRLFLQCFD